MSNETSTKAADERAETLKSRRQSLKDIGKFAAVTAPAMLVLLEAGSASACPDAGNKNGWQVNGKASPV
ncbi:MAG: hypothetical protein R3D57_18530 [Hyphomicrobiaceae bacterium]